jgi:hypothetical protein
LRFSDAPFAFTLTALAVAEVLSFAAPARAAEETDALFTAGVAALAEGRPGDAVADFEALADRGIVNAAASFDRGLAYASRVRIGAEQPGDLGRAAHGFAEARDIANDPTLTKDAATALTLVRAEVARRRAHTGDPVELDQGLALGRTVVELAPENAWAALAIAMSVLLGLGLFARRSLSDRRQRVGATVVCAVAAPLLVAAAVLTLAAKSERLHLAEGIVVATAARAADDKGIGIPGAAPIPEAVEVEILGARPGWVRVQHGSQIAWLPSQVVRPLARAR